MQLYNTEKVAQEIWVKITGIVEESGPQEPEPFIPETYSFISYGDATGTTQYAEGTVETVEHTEEIDSAIYRQVHVLTNSIADFEGRDFLIVSTAEVGDELYQLYDTNKVAQEIWVKITGIVEEVEP